jgi:hypothetical protein
VRGGCFSRRVRLVGGPYALIKAHPRPNTKSYLAVRRCPFLGRTLFSIAPNLTVRMRPLSRPISLSSPGKGNCGCWFVASFVSSQKPPNGRNQLFFFYPPPFWCRSVPLPLVACVHLHLHLHLHLHSFGSSNLLLSTFPTPDILAEPDQATTPVSSRIAHGDSGLVPGPGHIRTPITHGQCLSMSNPTTSLDCAAIMGLSMSRNSQKIVM